jgi:hypothetical protein
LLVLYLRFAWIVVTAYLVPLTPVELLVLSTMTVRVTAFILLPRLRRAKPALMFDILSVEVLAAAVLVPLYLVTGFAFLIALWNQLYVAWIFSLLLLGPSVMLFRYSRALLDRTRLSVLLPTSAAIFALLWSLQGISGSPAGGSGASSLVGSYALGLVQGGATAISSPEVAVSGILCFVSVGLYAIVASGLDGALRTKPLLIALLGIVGALAWVAGLSAFTNSSVFVLSVPTTAIGGFMWWVTRES